MFEEKTKCVIKKAPGAFVDLAGKFCQATLVKGAKDPDCQMFNLDSGDDDFGMERDFTEGTAAWNCFLEVISLDDVTMESLINRGFISA